MEQIQFYLGDPTRLVGQLPVAQLSGLGSASWWMNRAWRLPTPGSASKTRA